MTTTPAATAATATIDLEGPRSRPDHRGSWIPNGAMIVTRIMELRKRRGLMIALVVVNIGLPTLFLAVRLIAHAVDPRSYGPAGGYSTFTGLVAGAMYVFGFIVAATLGCTAGSADLTDGMFRHLVVTGRSRLALYLARIPAGLALIVPIVATGFAVVCIVCCFAAPTTLNYDGATLPVGMSRTALVDWAAQHPGEVLCTFPGPVPFPYACGPNGPVAPPGGVITGPGGQEVQIPGLAQVRAQAVHNAELDYADYSRQFLYPSVPLMVETGLWIELEAIIGFFVGLGLSSLLGQRTLAVILMVVLELILTPIFSRTAIPHLINLQRGVVGLAMAHIEPGNLPLAFGGGNGPSGMRHLVPESTEAAICVIIGWLVVWTVVGAWRMSTRDA